MRKDQRPFRQGIHRQTQRHVREIGEEFLLKQGRAVATDQTSEIVQLVSLEVEIVKIVHSFRKPARHGVAPLEGQPAKEEMKNRFVLRVPRQEIPLGHGELVEIGNKRVAHGRTRHAEDSFFRYVLHIYKMHLSSARRDVTKRALGLVFFPSHKMRHFCKQTPRRGEHRGAFNTRDP